MKVMMDDLIGKFMHLKQYVATFPVIKYPALNMGSFPIKVNPKNLEQMLFLLNSACYHPRISRLIRTSIPSPFFPDLKVPNRYLPLEPLLHYLGHTTKVHSIRWEDEVSFYKSQNGMEVKHYQFVYSFPDHSLFTQSFIDSFGRFQWSEINENEEIADYWFTNEANSNIPAILAPFETYFIENFRYQILCDDLYNICLEVEQIMQLPLFEWDNTQKIIPYISKILGESFSLDN